MSSERDLVRSSLLRERERERVELARGVVIDGKEAIGRDALDLGIGHCCCWGSDSVMFARDGVACARLGIEAVEAPKSCKARRIAGG